MKTFLQNLCQAIGVLMLLFTVAIAESDPGVILGWLTVSAVLMYIGKSFSFQKR